MDRNDDTTSITMKFIVTTLINIYQKVLKPILDGLLYSVFGFTYKCKYEESCSHYTLRQVQERGTIPGLKLGMKRVESCWGWKNA